MEIGNECPIADRLRELYSLKEIDLNERASGTRVETKKAKECKARILELSRDFNGSNKDDEVMAILQVSRNSFYKYKKELKNG